MWVISKEGLIVLGTVAVLGILGIVLLLLPPRQTVTPAPAPTTPAASTTPVVVNPPVTPAPAQPVPTAPAASAAPLPVAVPVTTTVVPSVAIDGIIYAGEYAHSTQATGFEIHWTNDARTLRVGLISPATGYLAIGFDPVNRMEGANYILGAVTDGQLTVRDDFGTGPTSHTPDVAGGGTNDILEAAGSEAGGRTYLEFVIPLDSGDAMDKVLVPGNTYKVVIAYHETSDDFGAWHSRRGSGTITLDPAP